MGDRLAAFPGVAGLSIGVRAVGSVLGGIGITPMVEIAVPFLSGGGSLAAITILSLGIVCLAFKSTSIGVSQGELQVRRDSPRLTVQVICAVS